MLTDHNYVLPVHPSSTCGFLTQKQKGAENKKVQTFPEAAATGVPTFSFKIKDQGFGDFRILELCTAVVEYI